MKFLSKILRRIGVRPSYTIDEFEDAKVENILYDHGKVIDMVRGKTELQRRRNAELRSVVNTARARSLQQLQEVARVHESL